MANSSFVQVSFLGGEISQAAQGRLDLPSYKVSLNVCLNCVIMETGAVQRRPGTRHAAINRAGGQGRVIPFTFAQSFPYNMVFSDSILRFTTGPALVMTNDAQAVLAISTASPAVVHTTTAHGWSTGNSVMFNTLGSNNPLLQNRQFLITMTDTTHFSIADAVTGAAVDGSTLGTFVSGNVTRILEIATIYDVTSWSTVRSVQAEARTVLLNGEHPQVLQVVTPPTTSAFATFTLSAADFLDGPYLDPIAGSIVTPSGGLNGVITLTLSFQAYDSTKAYNIGDFVTSAGLGYRSLVSPNQAHTPASSPTQWAPVNGGAAVNNGLGFQPSDVGRLVRLFSEPTLWSSSSPYTLNQIVAYSDGLGGFSYWTATGAISAGIQPGTSTLWALNPTAAQWTWGQITTVSGAGLISSVTPIGSFAGGGGLSAAFDGNTGKGFSSSATVTTTTPTLPVWSATAWSAGTSCQYNAVQYSALTFITPSSTAVVWSASTIYQSGNVVQYSGAIYQASATNVQTPPNTSPSLWTNIGTISSTPPSLVPSIWSSGVNLVSPVMDLQIGQHYSIATAIGSATLYPTIDVGFANSPVANPVFTVVLRAKATAPTSASDGTQLGIAVSATNTAAPVTIISSDQTTTWNYVWFEIVLGYNQPLPDDGSHSFTIKVGTSQAQFFTPTISNGSIIGVQIRGPALLYNLPVRTWRAGVYSDNTGWPTSGTYHEGRIWFGGVVSNRFDACVSNGLTAAQLNFAPTGPNGTVSDSNAITYICTGESSNQILWMKPDQQGILFGTQAGEWLISAPAQGPLSPTNIKAVRVTKIGCANIEPHRAEHTLLFVHKFGRKIMEYFADVYSGKFSAPNLSKHAKHLTVRGIVEIAYQQELTPTIWARRTDGALIGAIYQRDTLTTSQGPNIIGWHRHQLGSGRLLESLCVGPSQDGNLDSPSMITNDPATGIRHIELMTDLLDEGFALTDCFLLDNGIVPTSHVVQAAPTGGTFGSLILNGLWPHNGKTVTAYVAGLDCGDFTVASGSITIPFGDGISDGAGSGLLTAALVNSFTTLPAVVGFTYNSDGQLVRPVTQADTGAQSGPGWAKLGRQHRIGAQIYGAVNGSISFGTDFTTLYPARLRFADDSQYTVQQQWSGIYRDNANSLLDFDGMISWRISRPSPVFIMAVGGFDSKADV